jgi:teichoic acid transport system permease protein
MPGGRTQLSMKLARQIWYVAQSSLLRRYAGARLGVIWAVLQPALVFGVFWLVSVYGLRMGGGDGPPYYAVLFCGLLPWMTLSTSVSESAGVLRAHRHLINAHVLPSQALPAAVALEQGVVHVFLLAIVAAIFVANGIGPFASWVIIFFYWGACLLALAFAVGLVVSILVAGSEDATQSVSFLLLIWFWGSPIVWRPDTMAAKHLLWLQINPFYYVIEGYRGALLYGHFAPGLALTLLFWIEVLVMASVGIILHRFFRSRLPEWIQ